MIFAALGLFLIPLTAQSLTFSDCEGESVVAHHWIEGGHRVIGPGVVSYEESGSQCFDDQLGCVSSTTKIVTACLSGKALQVEVSADRERTKTKFDRGDEANQLVQALMDAEQGFSLHDIRTAFELRGFDVSEYVQKQENCACAAAFPALRNGKEKFEEQ